MTDDFATAVSAIVGPERALGLDSAALRRIRWPLGDGIVPVAGAAPETSDQVVSLVRLARERALGLAIQYDDRGTGATHRGERRTLVLDLSRMNKIVEVHADGAAATLEPGVTFAQLAEHLKGTGLCVASGRDPDASVLGSAYSRDFGYTPYGDHALMLCGAEYVTIAGRQMRTGMGAMPQSRTWHLYKFSLGPYSDGLAMQSGALVPTMAGIWLMPKPPSIQFFCVELQSEDALAPAIENLRQLKIGNVLPGTVTLADPALHKAIVGSRDNRGAWRLYGAVYGTAATVPIVRAIIDNTLSGIRDARFLTDGEMRADPACREHVALMAGAPGSSAVKLDGVRSTEQMSFVAPIEGRHSLRMAQIARDAFAGSGLRCGIEQNLVGRSLIQRVWMGCAGEEKILVDAATSLVARMADEGFGLIGQSFALSAVARRALSGQYIVQEQALLALS